MNVLDQSGNGGRPPPGRRRRPRYSGTHPKSYREKYKEHDIAAHPELLDHLRAKGKTPAGTHVPVLTEEVLACLTPGPGEVVADCTVGYGGHATEFMKRIGPAGRLIAFDVDSAELECTRRRLSKENVPRRPDSRWETRGQAASFYRSNFAGIANVLNKEKIDGYDVIFADLGVSSMQIDNPDRGMSYKQEGPLDMRMDDRLKRTGADLLNSLSEEQLSEAFLELADEPDHQEIARQIVARRAVQPITRTSQLVHLIFSAKGLTAKSPRAFLRKQERGQTSKSGSLHPAARAFQALRILVNDELGSLRELLRVAPYCLRPGGRIGIISFHSGEDRLVKQSFRDGVRNGIYQSAAEDAIVPQAREIASNPRSASAKFRWAIKPL